MGYILEITTTNYAGQLANITFYPCTGGSIEIGVVTLPYNYENDNFNEQSIFISLYSFIFFYRIDWNYI